MDFQKQIIYIIMKHYINQSAIANGLKIFSTLLFIHTSTVFALFEATTLSSHNTQYHIKEIEEVFIESWAKNNLSQIGDIDILKNTQNQSGFKSLFNGKNLDGWIGNNQVYKVENGDIVIDPTGGGNVGNLYTQDEYSDFTLRFEFQLTPGANNGLGIHAPLKGDAAYAGKELQILDNTADKYSNLEPYQYHGSVYGIIPAKRGFLKPVAEWNEQEVDVKGSKIKVILNGSTIVDGDFEEASKNGTIDGKNHPGLQRTSGHIGFLGHGDVLRFRNIRIREH